MAKEKITLDKFQDKALDQEQRRSVKGGFKQVPGIPGGSGSNGLVDWGEMEIRTDAIAGSSWSAGVLDDGSNGTASFPSRHR